MLLNYCGYTLLNCDGRMVFCNGLERDALIGVAQLLPRFGKEVIPPSWLMFCGIPSG